MGGKVTKEAFGVAHAGESNALIDETYKGATNCKPGTACYKNLERKKAQKCSAGTEWDHGKGKCVPKTGCGCKAGEEKVNGNCVPKCGDNQERVGANCVDKCGDNQTRIGNGCFNNCASNEIMQDDGSCKPKEEQKSCANAVSYTHLTLQTILLV